MDTITKAAVFEAFNRGNRRICFDVYTSQRPRLTTDAHYHGKINLPYGDKILTRIFPQQLFSNQYKEGHVWRGIVSEDEFNMLNSWCYERKDYVYMRDCLAATAALGFNRPSADRGGYTDVGGLVNSAKTRRDDAAIDRLVELSCEFMDKHPFYKDAQFVAAVPPDPEKDYDLPSEIAKRIADQLNIPDITPRLIIRGSKKTAKNTPLNAPDHLEQKWAVWEGAELAYEGKNLDKEAILLLDDNYQSGVSLQYVAMILQQHGAGEVYGLAMDKTLSK